jgi:hypothetical protein
VNIPYSQFKALRKLFWCVERLELADGTLLYSYKSSRADEPKDWEVINVNMLAWWRKPA